MKIRLANLRYSPNLGDGLIAQCLEASLQSIHPDADIASVDLAGRAGYPLDAGAGRGLALRLLQPLPRPVASLAKAGLVGGLVALRYKRRWRNALGHGSGLAIIGGGQLFADTDLNFPLKILGFVETASRLGYRFVIHGVGVSSDWSRPGGALFRRAMALARPVHIAVRDARSQQNWQHHMRGLGLPEPVICRDPALALKRTCQLPGPKRRMGAGTVGLGIVSPLTLKLHAQGIAGDPAAFESFGFGLASELVARGCQVRLFTNGPADDEAFAARILARCASAGLAGVSRASASRTPEELVQLISGFDAICAHRLHANIAAFALGVPSVGLAWDPKVGDFFASVGRTEFVQDAAASEPAATAETIMAAMATGMDEAIRESIAEEAFADIARTARMACA